MIWTLLLLLSGSAQAQEHSVMVTPDVSVQALRKKEARRLFTGQSSVWSDGRPVNLILPPMDSSAMAWLSSQVLGLPPDIYHRYLLEKAYRAGKEPPRIAASMDVIRQTADSTEAVLTVLPLPAGEGFRVVRIN
jgi:hypothetical protein